MSKVAITLYELATGGIKACCTVDDGVLHVYEPQGLGYLPGHYPGPEWRVDITQDPPVPVPLTAMNVTVLPNTISGIPAGTLALWDGGSAQVDDGVLVFDLELALPETIRVHLHHLLWLDWEDDVPCV